MPVALTPTEEAFSVDYLRLSSSLALMQTLPAGRRSSEPPAAARTYRVSFGSSRLGTSREVIDRVKQLIKDGADHSTLMAALSGSDSPFPGTLQRNCLLEKISSPNLLVPADLYIPREDLVEVPSNSPCLF